MFFDHENSVVPLGGEKGEIHILDSEGHCMGHSGQQVGSCGDFDNYGI